MICVQARASRLKRHSYQAGTVNEQKLKTAAAFFLAQYPEGFASPEMAAVNKKHNMKKMVELAQQSFAKRRFNDAEQIAEDMIKVVGRSSMVSMFEKPKFRDFVRRLDINEQHFLSNALKRMLHGKQQAGFEAMVELLQTEKIAKWSLVSIIPAYFAPTTEVFVKPTTAKGVIKYFEIDGLDYKPLPSWQFYLAYRELINTAKQQVSASLSPSNAAFSGFLMMSMKDLPH